MKKVTRSLGERLGLILAGAVTFAIGAVFFVSTFPLLLIIIGIFPVMISCGIMLWGIMMIIHSKYKDVECPKCFRGLNPGNSKTKICPKCKELLKFE